MPNLYWVKLEDGHSCLFRRTTPVSFVGLTLLSLFSTLTGKFEPFTQYMKCMYIGNLHTLYIVWWSKYMTRELQFTCILCVCNLHNMYILILVSNIWQYTYLLCIFELHNMYITMLVHNFIQLYILTMCIWFTRYVYYNICS